MGVWWHALAFVTHERAKMSHKPGRNVTQAGPKCHTRAKMSHSHVIIGAWQHQAITRTNVDLCLMRPQHIPFRANFSQLSITKIHFKITPYKITADSPWGQWVNTSTLPHPKPLFQVCHAHSSVHHSVCQLSRSQIAQPIHTLVNLPTWLFSQLSTAHPTGAINSLAPKRLWR